MKKYLQLALIFHLLFIGSAVFAQKERVKTLKVEQVNNTQEIVQKNISEERKQIKFKQAVNTNTIMHKIADSVRVNIPKVKLDEEVVKLNSTNTNALERLAISDNVTYEKETLPENVKITSYEKKSIKVAPSANYREREIKEDVHPVTDYSVTKITPNKRIYLQQEADDLQIEILQNTNNNGYDIVKKQKQLEEIKKMLKN